MDDYKGIYYKLFNRITDIINELKVVQQETEEMFLSQKQTPHVTKINTTNNNED